MIDALLIGSTFLLLSVTLLPLLPSDHWTVRVWEFPRLQIAVMLLLNGVAIWFIATPPLNLWLAVACGCALIYQLIWILPYTPMYPKQVAHPKSGDSSKSIRILTANVLMTNHSAGKLISLVEKHSPDVLVTLESDQWWQDALSEIHDRYPHRVNIPLDNLYGMHLYSRYPLEEVKQRYLIEKDIPSIHCYVRLSSTVRFKCHFVHPAPPSPTENESAEPRDRELILVAREVDPDMEPTIVTGDLNDVAWSPTTRQFRQISRLKDPRIGRGFFNTFHASYVFARWPLDHIFHSDHFRIRKISRLSSIDSDHFPLLSELVFEPQQ